MPTKEEELNKRTFKDDAIDTERRVLYTLTFNKDLTQNRTAKLLALLVSRQVDAGSITPEELDDLLLECTT